MYWFCRRESVESETRYLVDARKSGDANPIKATKDLPLLKTEAESWEQARDRFFTEEDATKLVFVFLTTRR